jgi:hypothetical protein
MKNQESVKLEFLMTVNDNIIVQRFFNVRGYNPDTENSIELYQYLKDFKDEFTEYLKYKTFIYMSDNMLDIIDNPSILDTSYTDGPEYFNIYIKKDNVTICHRVVDAKLYPPKIRYTVDIRPQIKNLLSSLTDISSRKNLTLNYFDIPLTK